MGPGRAILAVGMGISKADFNPSPSRRQCSDVDAGNRNGPFPHKAMLEIHGPLTVPVACQSRGVSPYQNKSTALHGQGRALSPAAAAAPADARGRLFSPPARGRAARRAPGTPSPALSHRLPPPSRIISAGRRLTRHTRRCGAVCAALPQPQGSRPAAAGDGRLLPWGSRRLHIAAVPPAPRTARFTCHRFISFQAISFMLFSIP